MIGVAALALACSKNDDPPKGRPDLTIDDVTVEEGLRAIFTVTLSEASEDTVSFRYVTQTGTALATDYSAIETYRVGFIAPGSLSTSISVVTYSDGVPETEESFTLVLSSVQNASMVRSAGLCTITNSDRIPMVSMDPLFTVNEGGDAIVTLLLNRPSPANATFTYMTRAESAGGADFAEVLTPKNVAIATGDTKVQIKIHTLQDNLAEDAESFSIVLSDFTNLSMANAESPIYILEDSKTFFMNAKIGDTPWTGLADGKLGASFTGGGNNVVLGNGQNFSQIRMTLYNPPAAPKHYKITSSIYPLDDDHITTEYRPFYGTTPGPIYWGVAGGELNILEVDLVNNVIKGTFNFTGLDTKDAERKVTVSNGVFRIPMNP